MNFGCSAWSRRTWQTSWQRKHSMHLRNSCTRSTSACAIRQVPSGASGFRGLNGLIFFLTSKFHETSVTRSRIGGKARIGSTVTGSSSGSSSQPRHAHQPRLAVDLRRAGAALARLAVPAASEVAGLRRLDAVDRVEHDHPGDDLGGVVAKCAVWRLRLRQTLKLPGVGRWQLVVIVLLFDDLLQFRRHLGNRHAPQLHRRRPARLRTAMLIVANSAAFSG